jgi:hypothetical protein
MAGQKEAAILLPGHFCFVFEEMQPQPQQRRNLMHAGRAFRQTKARHLLPAGARYGSD